MDISNQTNTEQLLASHCRDSANTLAQGCSPSALQTSPLSSPSTSPSKDRIPSESSREIFASRTSSSSHVTPPNSVPNSPRLSLDAHTPLQHFVNALDSPPSPTLVSATTSSAASDLTKESPSRGTCIVCMDEPKDIALAPCQHSHCCLACFRRTQLYACPICRTPVRSVILLSTRLELPVTLVAPKPASQRRVAARASVTFGEPDLYTPVLYERPRSLITRRSAPVINSYLREEVSSVHSRTTSVSSITVARQAESSVRSVPPSQEAAFRRLRATGTVRTPSELSRPRCDNLDRRHTLSTSSPSTPADNNLARANRLRRSPLCEGETIVLIGYDRKVMMSLAQKLISAFPPPPNNAGQAHLRDKSTLFVNGQALRLVIIESAPEDTGPELALRVQRQSPKLVLMCADFFNVSSFESIVRLDMEVLDYLNLPCTWILVKSLWMKRPRRSNSVGDADVRAAKHFLSSRRRCFLITIDVAKENTTMRKLGHYLHKAVYKGSTDVRNGSVLPDEHLASQRNSWSLFCLRIDRVPEQNRSRHRLPHSWFNLGRWLTR